MSSKVNKNHLAVCMECLHARYDEINSSDFPDKDIYLKSLRDVIADMETNIYSENSKFGVECPTCQYKFEHLVIGGKKYARRRRAY